MCKFLPCVTLKVQQYLTADHFIAQQSTVRANSCLLLPLKVQQHLTADHFIAQQSTVRASSCLVLP